MYANGCHATRAESPPLGHPHARRPSRHPQGTKTGAVPPRTTSVSVIGNISQRRPRSRFDRIPDVQSKPLAPRATETGVVQSTSVLDYKFV
jgi:hypothetical protein